MKQLGSIDEYADIPVGSSLGKSVGPEEAEEALRQIYQTHRMKKIILLGYRSDMTTFICAQWKLKMPDVTWLIPGWPIKSDALKTLIDDVPSSSTCASLP